MAVPYDDIDLKNVTCIRAVKKENSENIDLYTVNGNKVNKYDWYNIIDKKTEPIYTKTIKDMESITSVCIGFGVFLFAAIDKTVKVIYLKEEGGVDDPKNLQILLNMFNTTQKNANNGLKTELENFIKVEYLNTNENLNNYANKLKKGLGNETNITIHNIQRAMRCFLFTEKNIDITEKKFNELEKELNHNFIIKNIKEKIKLLKKENKIEDYIEKLKNGFLTNAEVANELNNSRNPLHDEFVHLRRESRELLFFNVIKNEIYLDSTEEKIKDLTFSNSSQTLIVQTENDSFTYNLKSKKKTKFNTTCICVYDDGKTVVATNKKITLYPGNKEIGTSIESPTTMCVSKNKTFIIGSHTDITLIKILNDEPNETKLAFKYDFSKRGYINEVESKINYIGISDYNKYIVARNEKQETYIWNTLLYDDRCESKDLGVKKIARYYFNPYYTNRIPQQNFICNTAITPLIIDKNFITYDDKINVWLLDNKFYYAKLTNIYNNDVYTKIQYSTLIRRGGFEYTSKYLNRPLKYKHEDGIVFRINNQYVGELNPQGKRHSIKKDQPSFETYGDEDYYYGRFKDGFKEKGVLKENNVCIHGKWKSGILVKSMSIKCHSNIITTQKKNEKKISWKNPTTHFLKEESELRGKCSFDGDKITISNETPFGTVKITGTFKDEDQLYIISGSNNEIWICSKDNLNFHAPLDRPKNQCWFMAAIQILKNLPDFDKFMIRVESLVKNDDESLELEKSKNIVSNLFNLIRVMQSGFLYVKIENDKETIEKVTSLFLKKEKITLYTEEVHPLANASTSKQKYLRPFALYAQCKKILNIGNEEANQDASELIYILQRNIEKCTGMSIINDYTHTSITTQTCPTCEIKKKAKITKSMIAEIKWLPKKNNTYKYKYTEADYLNMKPRKVEEIINDHFKDSGILVYCENCRKDKRFNQTVKIVGSPKILLFKIVQKIDVIKNGDIEILDLRKYKYKSKILNNITFERKIEVTDEIKINNTDYELISVGIASSAHWQSVIKTNGRWISYDGSGHSIILNKDITIHEHLLNTDPGFPAVLVYKKIS